MQHAQLTRELLCTDLDVSRCLQQRFRRHGAYDFLGYADFVNCEIMEHLLPARRDFCRHGAYSFLRGARFLVISFAVRV